MAVGICGRITAQYVLSRFHAPNARNCDTISTCCGIMMPISTNQKISQRNRNRIRDSAKAAMLATSTVPTAVRVEVMKLVAYQFQMSPWASSVWNDWNVGLWISQVVSVVSALGLSAVSTVQSTGTSQISANAMSTPAQIRLNSLVRRSIEAWVTGLATVVMVRTSVPGG